MHGGLIDEVADLLEGIGMSEYEKWTVEQRPYRPTPFDAPESRTVIMCGEQTIVPYIDSITAEHIVRLHNQYVSYKSAFPCTGEEHGV